MGEGEGRQECMNVYKWSQKYEHNINSSDVSKSILALCSLENTMLIKQRTKQEKKIIDCNTLNHAAQCSLQHRIKSSSEMPFLH